MFPTFSPIMSQFFRQIPSSRLSRLGLLLALLASLTWPVSAFAQAPDQVLWSNRGKISTVTGTVTTNSLTQVVVQTGDKERELDAADVQQVEFGDVPQTFADGRAYFDRGDYENAAAKFEVAATSPETRAVVQAAARLWAARAWLAFGVRDRTAFEKSAEQATRLIEDFTDNRDVPQARALLGRATWLSGNTQGAAELLTALFTEGSGEAPTPGYPTLVAYRAGLDAAQARLETGEEADVEVARGLFDSVATGLSSVLAGLEEDAADRRDLERIQTQARLGEGFCLLAAGQTSQAKTFFEGQKSSASMVSAQRFASQLGLGQALLAEGSARQAQIEFAQVSALDHTDRDRVARALVGLAECSLALDSADSRKAAKISLDTILAQYGDTPAVLRAQELSQTL